MEEYEHKSKRLRKQDRYLLSVALVLGVTATLRAFAGSGISITAVALLAGATVFAVFGFIGFFSGGRSVFSNTKKIIVVLAGVHIVSTLFFFPPEDLVNPRPILTLDHAVHYYQVVRAGEICGESFCLHAYDPYFMAGHPGGTVFDIDSKGAELFSSLFKFMGSARALKLFVLFAHLLMVATVYFGCHRLKFRDEECAYAALLLLAFWHWGRPYAGDFRFAGMFAFLFVTHLSFYLVGAFNSLLERTSFWSFFIVGPLTFLVHPTAAVLLPVPFIALFLVQRRRIADGKRRYDWAKGILIRMVVWCLLVFAVNAIWIFPLVRYLDIKLPSQTYFQIQGVTELLAILIKPGTIPAIGVCLLAIAGSVRLFTEKRHIELFVPASGSLFLILLAGYGVYIPGFDQMEPGRFLYSGLLFMVPLAGAGLRVCLEIAGRFMREDLHAKFAKAILIFLFVISPWLGFLSARSFFRHTLSTTMTPEVKSLVAALQENTDSSGRLMIEDGPAWRYGHSHFPSIVPLLTGVEQIGGPYPKTFIKHHFATFQMTETMGKPLQNWEAGALIEYLELYNVRWILTASSPSAKFMEKINGFKKIWSSKHFSLWLVPGHSTFADVEGISVRAAYNRIDVAINAQKDLPPPERIILKYHWDRALRVDPPARISQIMFLDDPVPFIQLEPNGESSVRITYR